MRANADELLEIFCLVKGSKLDALLVKKRYESLMMCEWHFVLLVDESNLHFIWSVVLRIYGRHGRTFVMLRTISSLYSFYCLLESEILAAHCDRVGSVY